MILREVGGGLDGALRQSYPKANGISPADPRAWQEYLHLGRIVTKPWSSNSKLIERLFMHERRIERSLFRAMTELKKLQIMRRIERDGTAKRPVARAPAAQNPNGDFVKQSQSAQGLMGATPVLERHYNDIARPDTARKKANQTQFQTPVSPKMAGSIHPLHVKARWSTCP